MAHTPETVPANFVLLSDDEFAAYAKTTRTKTPSPYELDVKSAKVGQAYMREIPVDEVSRTVVYKLTKAAKALNVKIQIIVREKATPPVVVFRVLPPVVTEGAESE
jgi:hypothetical protein